MSDFISKGIDNIPYNVSINIKKNIPEVIKKIFAFLSVSSLFIGGTGFFKTYIGYILLGIRPSLQVCFAVFLVSFSVYTLDKVADMEKDVTNMPERLRFLKGRKKLAISYSLFAYFLSLLFIYFDHAWSACIVLVPIAANIVYGTRLIPGLPRLKDIPVMKNLTVALSWALVTILLPAMHLSDPKTFLVGLIVYFMLVKTFIDTVLYDIRDAKGDRENGVRTIPVLIGTKKTVVVLLALNSTLFFALPFFCDAVKLLMLALILYGYAYIPYFRERQNPLVLDFCVEGEWMLACTFLITVLGGAGFI
jgi:4-hydroxybenzoate polyprenyltransferase